MEQILSGEPTEIVVENIHEYLTKIGGDIRNGSIKLDEFIIFKVRCIFPCSLQLRSDFSASVWAKIPSIIRMRKANPMFRLPYDLNRRVAQLRLGMLFLMFFACLMAKSRSRLHKPIGLSIPMKFGKTQSSQLVGWIDDSFFETSLNLILDYDYYLSNQILPPIERLCEPIEGTDRSRLAECLGMCLLLYKILKLEFFVGLDPTRYRTSSGADERTFSALDAQISDVERFRDATPFCVRCRHCQGQLAFSISELEVSRLL